VADPEDEEVLGAGSVELPDDGPEAPPQATISVAVAAAETVAAMNRTRRTAGMVRAVSPMGMRLRTLPRQ
jgi:hypothetical protein